MSEATAVDTQESQKSRRFWLWILLAIPVVLAGAAGGFAIWALNPGAQVGEEARLALVSGDSVTVTENAWIAFVPHRPPKNGFILYPGARVPAEAYAPLARGIAEAGHLAVIAYAPLNLTLLNNQLAKPIMQHYAAVDRWVIGGHSLGGTSAFHYTLNNMDTVSGLVLIAAYVTDDSRMDEELPVLVIYGTEDGLSTPEEIEGNRGLLPASTQFVAIEGGNHGQFGYYGPQAGDKPATISHAEQISQAITVITSFLARLE